MNTIVNTPTHKVGDYSQQELSTLTNLQPQEGITGITKQLAIKWKRDPKTVHAKWYHLHRGQPGMMRIHKKRKKQRIPISVTNMPTGTKRAYKKSGAYKKHNLPISITTSNTVMYQKGKNIQEMVLESGGPGPSRGMRASTIELMARLKPLVAQMLPLGNPQNVIHSIPIVTANKETVRKLLKNEFKGNKYVISTIVDNKKMSRIFRYK